MWVLPGQPIVLGEWGGVDGKEPLERSRAHIVLSIDKSQLSTLQVRSTLCGWATGTNQPKPDSDLCLPKKNSFPPPRVLPQQGGYRFYPALLLANGMPLPPHALLLPLLPSDGGK